MKRLPVYLIFLLTLVCCATKGKTPLPASEGKPDVFCNVIQEPHPLLIGTYECSFRREKVAPPNFVKYRLLKYDDKYALYFHRTWRRGRKKIREWKNWDINGQEITAEYEVKIFVQGGDVYFTIRGLKKPAKMTRIGD